MTTQSDPAVPAETARSTPDIELHLNDTTDDKPVLRNGIRCIRRSLDRVDGLLRLNHPVGHYRFRSQTKKAAAFQKLTVQT